ncbi:MAG: hypothetical protein H7318_17745 [Oligoflexus sp.]|nr:hypothetical protein [Oligoflexus sp.]
MIKKILFLLISFMPLDISAEDQHAARLVIHLLDYLAKDYPGAVNEAACHFSMDFINES